MYGFTKQQALIVAGSSAGGALLGFCVARTARKTSQWRSRHRRRQILKDYDCLAAAIEFVKLTSEKPAAPKVPEVNRNDPIVRMRAAINFVTERYLLELQVKGDAMPGYVAWLQTTDQGELLAMPDPHAT